ncbi:carboxypeptidase regulatory-like domain-containing protein [Calothrix sp. 336/3]|uniref:carboxypeptidase regulatory-like domain-containing protein n=1 Tax=Calothrix sp. 336/3 TaxID=1337936 RepID=UPI000ABD265C|nr:carboxypeptidase regulatory-like domain-containing protein [Calothrix sp. 336/3]
MTVKTEQDVLSHDDAKNPQKVSNCLNSVNSQKPGLANNILHKLLASSTLVKGYSENQSTVITECNSNSIKSNIQLPRKKSEIVDKLLLAKNNNPHITENKSNSSDNGNNETAENATSETVASTVTADKNNPNQNISSDQANNQLSYNRVQDTNPINNILATVQQLISASLYASLNRTVTDITPTDTSQSSNRESTENSNNSSPQEIASLNLNTNKILALVQEFVQMSISASLNSNIPNSIDNNTSVNTDNTNNSQKLAAANNSNTTEKTPTDSSVPKPTLELARRPDDPFLVGILINGREVGTIDIIQNGNILLLPIDSFADIANLTFEVKGEGYQVVTPLGNVQISENEIQEKNGIKYISNVILAEKLKIKVELNTADLTLLTDLPWRAGTRQNISSASQLKPDFLPPGTGISNFRQELSVSRSSGSTDWSSSTLVGGRLFDWSYQLRLNNNFVNEPDLSEYYLYKRSGAFQYQLGRQNLALHPLLNGMSFTGFQVGYTNLPANNLYSSYGANELIPRRSQPIQTFRGQAPAASIVQLRVSGVIIAQQQVGFNGQYEFLDVNLPVGQNNEIEVLIFDRSNLRVPAQIRSVRINASDLLLPSGGNVQLGGVGFSGNLVQNNLLGNANSDYDGKLTGFYQIRQGLSKNLTLEAGVQAVPDTLQTQAGFIWRLANPLVLSANIGSSNGELGYSADLDFQLDRLDITANSQELPEGYQPQRKNGRLSNHSLEVGYRFNNSFNLGFIARSRQDESESVNYVLPTFYARPFSSLSLSGRPDLYGRYLLNAFYQPNNATRLTFNTFGDNYISDLSYKFGRDYQLSLGNEFGGNAAARYSLSFGRTPNSLRELSWNLGLAVSDGEIGPIAGASMQVLPGLFARIDYQGIPSRTRGFMGGFGDDRLTLSLVSDLSFAGGRVTPSSNSGISKDRGAIAGRLKLEGSKEKFDLSGSNIQVFNNRNQNIGSTRTDSQGNFYLGNLPEGVYSIQVEPDELPVELSVMKTSAVAKVASSAVTNVDFAVRPEFGVAGRVTDVSGQAVPQVRVELLNGVGSRVLSAVTDQFGLYRLDGVPVGKYTLRVSPLDALNSRDTLPKLPIEIRNEFVYEQNLKLPISAAAKQKVGK